MRPLLRLACLSCLVALLLLAPTARADDPPGPARQRSGMRVERDVVYAALSDERSLHLDLYLPEAREHPPLVVWVHGGGWRGGNKQGCPLTWMVGQGFAVASVEYRLSGESTFPAQIHDVKGAVRWLRANAEAKGYDATRIGMGGSSAGGHLVALMGTSGDVKALEGDVGGNLDQSSRVQAIYDLYGPANFLSMKNHFGARSPVAQLLGGPVAEQQELAKQGSPVTHVSVDDPPFWIVHGDVDRTVPVAQSHELHEALEAAEVLSHLEVIEGAGHGGREFRTRERRDDVLAFFRRHLEGVTTPSPVAPDSAIRSVIATHAAAGRHEIRSIDTLVLHDDARKQDLQVKVTYPTAEGTFPVIVWSHGLGGSKDAYAPIVEHWAGHGYVVVQATHSDSLQLGRDATGFRAWQSRPVDVAFLLDSLPEIRTAMDGFAGTLSDVIGLGGHSFGAHTTQLVGGVTTTGADGERESHADPRPKALLVLSGQGRGDMLDEASWTTLVRPTLVLTGTLDAGRGGQPFTWRTEPYTYAPEGDKTLVVIKGARHTFGGISGSRRGRQQANTAHVDAVKATTLLFWNAYLKADGNAKALLRSDRIPTATDNAVRVAWK